MAYCLVAHADRAHELMKGIAYFYADNEKGVAYFLKNVTRIQIL